MENEVQEGEGGSWEGERKKGRREKDAPPSVVVPTCYSTERSVGLAGQLKRCRTEWKWSAHSGQSEEGSASMRCR